ncbi:MAG: hypothetical protein AAGI17_07595 [Planctomycetota bacterium]
MTAQNGRISQDAVEHAAELRELLDRQSISLDRLERLASLDAAAPEGGLGERAGVLAELEPLARRIGELRSGIDPLGPMALAIEQAQARYGAVYSRWTEDATRLGNKRDELSKRLRGVGAGRRAAAAYGGAARPRFQDREG